MLDYNNAANWEPEATRTLYVGKIDAQKSSINQVLREAFDKFGQVEHIEVKIPPNSAPPYAFCTFRRVAQAMAAKSALHNTMIGRSIVQIGYGKVCKFVCMVFLIFLGNTILLHLGVRIQDPSFFR